MRKIPAMKWIARSWGTVILAFVLFFVVAGIFGDEPDVGLQNTREIIIFALFPVGTLLGLTLALKWEGPGGLIATTSLLGLFVLRPDLLASPVFPLGIAPPGFLYLAYWLLSRPKAKSSPRIAP